MNASPPILRKATRSPKNSPTSKPRPRPMNTWEAIPIRRLVLGDATLIPQSSAAAVLLKHDHGRHSDLGAGQPARNLGIIGSLNQLVDQEGGGGTPAVWQRDEISRGEAAMAKSSRRACDRRTSGGPVASSRSPRASRELADGADVRAYACGAGGVRCGPRIRVLSPGLWHGGGLPRAWLPAGADAGEPRCVGFRGRGACSR